MGARSGRSSANPSSSKTGGRRRETSARRSSRARRRTATTLAMVGASVTINPALHGARVVDPVREFTPVIQLTTQPIVLVAHPSLEASSMSDVIALARSPGRLAYSTPESERRRISRPRSSCDAEASPGCTCRLQVRDRC
jgi:hypothetical protein